MGGPGPLWLLQRGCPPSGSDPAPPFVFFFGPSPPLVPRATGPSSGPPSTSTDGDTLPLAPSPCCSMSTAGHDTLPLAPSPCCSLSTAGHDTLPLAPSP